MTAIREQKKTEKSFLLLFLIEKYMFSRYNKESKIEQ